MEDERYDYKEAMITDIIDHIRENYTTGEIDERLNNREEWEEELFNELWTADGVTGNASGSYTFSIYQAETYIAHNLDLLAEALREFGDNVDVLKKGAEWCDVTIRCYSLSESIRCALDKIEEEFMD